MGKGHEWGWFALKGFFFCKIILIQIFAGFLRRTGCLEKDLGGGVGLREICDIQFGEKIMESSPGFKMSQFEF